MSIMIYILLFNVVLQRRHFNQHITKEQLYTRYLEHELVEDICCQIFFNVLFPMNIRM